MVIPIIGARCDIVEIEKAGDVELSFDGIVEDSFSRGHMSRNSSLRVLANSKFSSVGTVAADKGRSAICAIVYGSACEATN